MISFCIMLLVLYMGNTAYAVATATDIRAGWTFQNPYGVAVDSSDHTFVQRLSQADDNVLINL